MPYDRLDAWLLKGGGEKKGVSLYDQPLGGDYQWRPPKDAEDIPGSDFQWEDDWKLDEMVDMIGEGDFKDIGIADLDGLNNLFDTKDWRALDNETQVEVLKIYQNHIERQNPTEDWGEVGRELDNWNYNYIEGQDNWGDSRHQNRFWGLDLQRNYKWDKESQRKAELGIDESGKVDAKRWFNVYSGSWGNEEEILKSIDWSHYNNDNAYLAASKNLGISGHSSVYSHDKYSTGKGPSKIRHAQNKMATWSDEEKQESYQWAASHYRNKGWDAEDALQEDSSSGSTDDWIRSHKTMHFIPELNRMQYFDHKTGEYLEGKDKTHLPSAPPQNLRIEIGEGSEPTFDADGNRIANEGDITGWYKRYLNRTPDANGLQHWLDEQTNNGMSFAEIEWNIQKSPEAKEKGFKDFGVTYYNPQKYGSPTSLTAKMKNAPAPIQAPTITIRNIGEPKKPTGEDHWYNALPDEWLTKAPTVGAASSKLSKVDARHNRGDTGLDRGHVGKFTKHVVIGDS